MAADQGILSNFGLHFQADVEHWRPPRMKTEEQRSSKEAEDLRGERKTPLVIQAGSIKEFLQRRPAQQLKKESTEALLQHWETQWQEFLKTVESPHSGWGIPQLLVESTPWDDTKGFLASYEQVAEACQWPKEVWATRLLPALSGEAEQAFSRLDPRDREDYGKVPAFEEKPGTFCEAKQVPSDLVSRQVSREGDSAGVRPLGKGLINTSKEDKCQPKGSDPEEPIVISEWRAKQPLSQCPKKEGEPPSQRGPKRHPKSQPGEEGRKPIPFQSPSLSKAFGQQQSYARKADATCNIMVHGFTQRPSFVGCPDCGSSPLQNLELGLSGSGKKEDALGYNLEKFYCL
uniref:Uncharacterized protein n=1 Tax=Sphaerodactylus townsendi TaxID=933632 RepID=A0ACB8EFK4_9SAUR